jgi:hypothetical protein
MARARTDAKGASTSDCRVMSQYDRGLQSASSTQGVNCLNALAYGSFTTVRVTPPANPC